MGCPWLNKFINTHQHFLIQTGIITRGKITNPTCIFDFSGHMFRQTLVYLQNHPLTDYDDLYYAIKRHLQNIISLNKSATWYVVFDPCVKQAYSVIDELKHDEWVKRNSTQQFTNNIPNTDIVHCLSFFYFPLKEEDIFKGINFVMSQHESDVMCGKLAKANPGSITLSTDSDCIIHSYPNAFYNVTNNWIIDTKRLFDILNVQHPQYLPQFYGCDYQQSVKKFPSVETLTGEYMNLTTDKQYLITACFLDEHLIERDEPLKYDCKKYKEIIEELLHINPRKVLLQF